jgi:hypothetical protein
MAGGAAPGPRNIFVFSEKEASSYKANMFRGRFARAQRAAPYASKKTNSARVAKKSRGQRTIPSE